MSRVQLALNVSNLDDAIAFYSKLFGTEPAKVRPGYAGSPLDGVEAKRDGNGELLLRSPMNMLGYYKDAAATREASFFG